MSSSTVLHSALFWDANCATQGAFNLIGTRYGDRCCSGSGGCPLDTPPVRYWSHDGYFDDGNFGCPTDLCGLGWIKNGQDYGGGLAGHWVLYMTNWFGPFLDGCPNAPPDAGYPPQRTDADVAQVYETGLPGPGQGEGTVGHASWYLLASAGQNDFDFDRVRGADMPPAPDPSAGCGRADVKASAVPPPRILGRIAPCTGDPTTTAGVDSVAGDGHFEVDVRLDGVPAYYTEIGKNDPSVLLIEGQQVLYAVGAEPTSSLLDTAAWSPVRDPVDPTQVLGTVPYGQRQVRIAVPCSAGGSIWLATRIVYVDCSLNGSRNARAGCPFPVPDVPPLGTQLSGHCGPLVEPVGGCS